MASISSISSISGSSAGNAWANAGSQRAMASGRMAERIQAKFDSDNSGGIDTTELKSMIEDVAKKTGISSDASAADLLAKNDSNGDGNLSGEELESTLKSVMPAPPSTMEFAQSRGATGQAGDNLFSKVDSDGDGAVSQTELQGLLEKMSGSTASQTGVSADASNVFSQLDANGDGGLTQAEFEAGRPSEKSAGSTDGPTEGMPPPPAGGPPPTGGVSASSSSEASTTTYDPLDTNEDGVVSLMEQLVGAENTTSTSTSTSRTDTTDSTGSTTATQSSTSKKDKTSDDVRQDLAQLADLASRQYAAVANNLSGQTQGSSLSVMA